MPPLPIERFGNPRAVLGLHHALPGLAAGRPAAGDAVAAAFSASSSTGSDSVIAAPSVSRARLNATLVHTNLRSPAAMAGVLCTVTDTPGRK